MQLLSSKTKYYAVIVGSFVQMSLLGINLLITSKMPLSDRGIYALIVAVLLTVSGICNFGFTNALIKRLHEVGISSSYLFSMIFTIAVQFVIAVFASLLLLYSFPNIGNDIIYDNGLIIVSVVASLILRVYLQSFLVGLNRITEFQISKLIPVSSFFLILLIRDRYVVNDILFAWLISEVMLDVLLISYLAKNITFTKNGEVGAFKHDLYFGAKSLFGQSSFIEGYKIDQILVGYLLPLSEVAIYAVTKSVSLVLRFIPQSLSQVAYPAVLSVAKNKKLRVIRAYVVFSIFVSLVLLFAGQYLFDNYVVDFIGEEYREGNAILFLLFLGVFAYTPRRILYEYFKAIDKPGITSVIEVLVLIAYATGIIILSAFDAIDLINLAASVLIVNSIILLFVLAYMYFVNKALSADGAIPAERLV